MVVQSRWQIDVPECSLPTWVFGGANTPLPEKPQFIDADRPETHFLTQRGYRTWSKRVAVGLRRAGLKPGDRVLLYSGNNIFVPPVFMGILMAGGVFTGANPSYVARELAYQLKDSGASFLIAADKSLEVAVDAAKQAGLPLSKVYSFDDTAFDAKFPSPRVAGTRHWTELLTSAPESEAEKFVWDEPSDPKTATLCLNYSSGTTGVPKGVEISHYSYVANGESVIYVSKTRPDYDSWQSHQVQLCFLPMYHAFGQTYFVCNFAKMGNPVYMMPGFDFLKMLQHIQRFKVTNLMAVPPIVVALAKHPLSKKYDLSSVEGIGCGAAPLGLEVSEEVSKLWPHDPSSGKPKFSLQQGWGMTEVTCSAMGWSQENALSKSPTPLTISTGELMPNNLARLVNPDDGSEITSPDTRGELWIAGPTLMKGYWNKPEATAGTMSIEGNTRWLKTGDIAYVTEYAPGGKWFIVDRIKELIKVKGNQVAPAELEGILLENPSLVDAAVVGVTINGEEVPRGYVVVHPDMKGRVTEAHVAKYMENKVVRYKQLKGGVVFVDEVPKNPSGKLLRKVLRDRAAQEVGDKKPKL